MAKVEAHGIRGNYSRWIRNWLTGRTQRVVIHDETSDPALVTSGVPQGSVLGPLLFIIYINDLDVGIISKINKFTDYTKLCHRAFTERDRTTIESDLNRLLQWTETWQMSFNIEKCSVMHVGANNRDPVTWGYHLSKTDIPDIQSPEGLLISLWVDISPSVEGIMGSHPLIVTGGKGSFQGLRLLMAIGLENL
ncbi:Reverse transcriptase domain [Trinorchestia longiramus]|nr:Reverse transcriptase domain [Trinorchestia longiramus]